MNNYIQNKLDLENKLNIFCNNLQLRSGILNSNLQSKYKLSIDTLIPKMAVLEFLEQSLTDYHNHIVEKYESLKVIPLGKDDDEYAKALTEFFHKDIKPILLKNLSLLQDTNPKE